MQITLCHEPLNPAHIFRISGKEDPVALRGGFRFDNKGLGSSLIELSSERWVLLRKKPGLWVKRVFVGELFSHSVEISSELVFSRDSVHCWEMVNPLVGLHSLKPLLGHSGIAPA